MPAIGLSKVGTYLVVGALFASLAACGSSDNKGSKVDKDGGAGSGGSSSGGTGGAAGGTGGAAGGTGGSPSCTDFGQTQQCTDCLMKNCCTESAACGADADCKALVACNEKCPDPINTSSACVQTCVQQHPNGVGDHFNGLILCMNQQCATPTCNYP